MHFLHRIIQICIFQDDTGVLRFQAEYTSQTMRFRVPAFKSVGNGAGPDKGKHIDISRFHQRAYDFPSLSIHDIDYAFRQCLPKSVK